MEKAESGLLLYGRLADTDHISVTHKEKKESLAVEAQPNGIYGEHLYTEGERKLCLQSEAADGTALGTAVTYEETGIAESQPKQPEQKEATELHITDEQGLKDIAKAPDKTLYPGS